MDDLEWLLGYEIRLAKERIEKIKLNVIEELEDFISIHS